MVVTRNKSTDANSPSTPIRSRRRSPSSENASKTVRTPTKRLHSPERTGFSKLAMTPTKERNTSPDRGIRKSTRTPTKQRSGSPNRSSTPVSSRTPTKQRNDSPDMIMTTKSLRTPTKQLNTRSDQANTPTCGSPAKLPSTPVSSRTPCGISNLGTPMTGIDIARMKLHVSALPDTPSGRSSLPGPLICRESEFKVLHVFLSEKIRSRNSGYMFISGIPGSGKTATVHRVIKRLQSENRERTNRFKYVEINGLYLSDPSRAYCTILEKINEEIATAKQAQNSLNDIFNSRTSKHVPVILFVDEMDCIYSRSPAVITNILQWHQKPNSQLIILTVANDNHLAASLKEAFNGKIEINYLIFDKYSDQDLEKIVMNRLQGNNIFEPSAVEFVIKNCVSKDGDARKVLDIFRKVLDIVTENENSSSVITLSQVQNACEKMSVEPYILAIKSFSTSEQILLRTIRDETSTYGVEECSPIRIYSRFQATCLLDGEPCPSTQNVCRIAANLKNMGFLKIEGRLNIHCQMKLNIDPNVINAALYYRQ